MMIEHPILLATLFTLVAIVMWCAGIVMGRKEGEKKASHALKDIWVMVPLFSRPKGDEDSTVAAVINVVIANSLAEAENITPDIALETINAKGGWELVGIEGVSLFKVMEAAKRRKANNET